jgi:hypothetical protein
MPRGGVTIQCPVCGSVTDGLPPTCGACGAFVQDRVPALNLFATFLGLIERPGATFLRIARSEQKNYVYTIFAGIGPLLLALALAIARVGDGRLHFGLVLILLLAGGPLFGLLLLSPAAWLVGKTNRVVWKLRVPFRATASAVAWALFPLLLCSTVVLTVQVGLFGSFLFSQNPAPWALKATAFWALAGVDGACLLWALLLLPRGFAPYGLSAKEGTLSMLPSIAFLCGAVYAAGTLLSLVLV